MKKICIIIPYFVYFGRWPRWFKIYLETCKYNPTINWLFYTDCGKPKNSPNNVSFTAATIKDFNLLASRKIGLKINIKNPYKLHDFRPAYGIIFEDYLRDYDFWGYSDVDLIYGDMRKFITEGVLANYNIITSRREYMVGHFTLFKNASEINKLYEKSPDYKIVFQNQKCYGFGECNFEWDYLLSDKTELNRKSEVISMTHLIKKLSGCGDVKVFCNTIGKEDWELKKEWKVHWNQGKLIDISSGEEFLYFHFIKLKHNKKFLISNWHKIPDNFFITKNGIFHNREIRGVEKLLKISQNYLRIEVEPLIGRFGKFLRWIFLGIYYKLKGQK